MHHDVRLQITELFGRSVLSREVEALLPLHLFRQAPGRIRLHADLDSFAGEARSEHQRPPRCLSPKQFDSLFLVYRTLRSTLAWTCYDFTHLSTPVLLFCDEHVDEDLKLHAHLWPFAYADGQWQQQDAGDALLEELCELSFLTPLCAGQPAHRLTRRTS